MNIVHIITTIEFGGAEKQLLILARAQARLGHKVSVVYLKGMDELKQSFLDSGIQVIDSLSSRPFVIQIFLLRNVLFSNAYDIWHAHLPRSEVLLALSSCLMHKSGVLISSKHNAERFIPQAPKFISRTISRLCSIFFNSHIYISNAVAHFIRDSREISKRKTSKVIHYAYDETLDLKSPSVHKLDSPLHFLFVGRFEPQKNLFFLINTFKQFRKTFPKDSLTLVGRGSQEAELKLKSDEGIFFLPRTSEVENIYSSYDCLVLPSLYEGFGLVLLEAMAAGIPILCSNVSAMPEVMGNRYMGTFNPGEESSLIRKLTDLHDPIFFGFLATYCAERIKDFGVDKAALATLRLYEKAIRSENESF